MDKPRSTLVGDDTKSAAAHAHELAGRATERAARARQHAAQALRNAEQDAKQGNFEFELRHRREAELHHAAAIRHEAAVERLRRLAAYLRSQGG